MPFSQQKHHRDAVKVASEQLLSQITTVMSRVNWPGVLELADRLPEAKRIYVTGAGRSGLVARMFAMRLMHAGLTSFVPGETNTPAADSGDLLVAISCTGETGYTDYLAQRARYLGARVVAITAEPNSTLAREADQAVIIPADAEDIVLRAAVFEHATSLSLDAVFNVLSERFKVDAAAFKARHANLE